METAGLGEARLLAGGGAGLGLAVLAGSLRLPGATPADPGSPGGSPRSWAWSSWGERR